MSAAAAAAAAAAITHDMWKWVQVAARDGCCCVLRQRVSASVGAGVENKRREMR